MCNGVLDIFAFPLSLILAAVMLVCILLYPKSCPRSLSVALLGLLALGFAVLGSIRPIPFQRLILSPLLLAATFFCGLTARDGIKARRKADFILSHLGLAVLLGSALFAAPGRINSFIILEKDTAAQRTEDGRGLPFELALKEVHSEFYEGTAMPKQHCCTVEIDSRLKQISVNHPAVHKGWLIYLSDFERDSGNRAMLRVVRDPSIPGVLLGMILLLTGAVLGLKQSWKSPLVIPALIVLTIVFCLASVSRIHFSQLPPALRSFWFAPHLIVYMIAYAALALSLLFKLLSFIPRLGKLEALSRPLLLTSSNLILMGIIFGAIWAQLCWGEYWAWDAKECWAAATYLLCLGTIHLREKKSRAGFVCALLLSFAAMQMTWYGVNYLPSAKDSMHTYNSK